MPRNDVNTRYYIGPFNGVEYPMAIDKCLPFTVLGNNFQRVECISETEALWTFYDDEDCTVALETQVANSSTQTGMGNYLDFNCNPEYGDEYAEIEFYIYSCYNAKKVTVYAALDVCVVNTDLYLLNPSEGNLSNIDSIRVYCNENSR